MLIEVIKIQNLLYLWLRYLKYFRSVCVCRLSYVGAPPLVTVHTNLSLFPLLPLLPDILWPLLMPSSYLVAITISAPLVSLIVSVDFQKPKHASHDHDCDSVVYSMGPPIPDWLVLKSSYFWCHWESQANPILAFDAWSLRDKMFQVRSDLS
jgi:hypothetical protein